MAFLLFLLAQCFVFGGAAARAAVQPLVDVPVRYVRGALLVDHVRINGKGDHTFLVDTGSTACTLTSEVATRIGIPKGGWSNVSAIGATRRLQMLKVASIGIEGAVASAPLTLLADDNGLSRHVGSEVDGVLGTPFLWKWVVQIDYPAKRLRLFSREYDVRTEPVEAPWSGVAPLTMKGRATYVKVALNGAKPHEMMLDTGATGIVVNEARATEAKARLASWKSSSLGAFGPRRDSLYWLLDSVRVAGLTINNAQAFTPQHLGDWRSDQLGNDALDQFRVTVDASRRLLRLERDQMPDEWADSPWGVGLDVRQDMDGYRVARVRPETEAATSGILAGDRLEMINAMEASTITPGSVRDLLNQPPGYTVSLEVRAADGIVRPAVTLTSKRYTRQRPDAAANSIATSLSVVQPTAPGAGPAPVATPAN